MQFKFICLVPNRNRSLLNISLHWETILPESMTKWDRVRNWCGYGQEAMREKSEKETNKRTGKSLISTWRNQVWGIKDKHTTGITNMLRPRGCILPKGVQCQSSHKHIKCGRLLIAVLNKAMLPTCIIILTYLWGLRYASLSLLHKEIVHRNKADSVCVSAVNFIHSTNVFFTHTTSCQLCTMKININ